MDGNLAGNGGVFFLGIHEWMSMLFVLLPPVLGKLIDATKNKKAEEVGEKKQITYCELSLFFFKYVYTYISDLSRGHPKWWFSRGISPKCP